MNDTQEVAVQNKPTVLSDLSLYGIAIALLFCFIYYETALWMFERWTVRDSYYSHGFLIPLMSGYLIWRKRKELALIPISYSSLGLLFLVPAFLLQVISAFWRIHFTSAFSCILMLLGLSYILLGRKISKILLFPIFYLCFMIPLPLVMIAEFSLRLKLLAATLALKISSLFGVMAVQNGAILYFEEGQMIVGDVCSGLRSLIALLAFGAFYAYITKHSVPKKWLIFLVSMPIALLANVSRIVVLCFIAQIWGVDKTSGIVHDASGILIFIVAFILLFSFERFLKLFGKDRENAAL